MNTSRTNKLSPEWIDPGTILSKLSETNYVELSGKNEKSQVYHINMLKPYYKHSEHINFLLYKVDETNQIHSEPELPYLESNPNLFNICDIIANSNLENILNKGQIDQLKVLICKYNSCFSNVLGKTGIVGHEIELLNDEIVISRPCLTSPRQTEILKNEIQKMLSIKIIEIGESVYTSSMILEESLARDSRQCIDYRKLNKIKNKMFSFT